MAFIHILQDQLLSASEFGDDIERMCKLHEQGYSLATRGSNTGELGRRRWDDCNLFQRALRFYSREIELTDLVVELEPQSSTA